MEGGWRAGPESAPRVCIVTPGQLWMNPRAVKEATALSGAGYRVHVVATRLSHGNDSRDRDILDAVPWTVERVDFTGRSRWVGERLATGLARRLDAVVPSPRLASLAHSALARRLAAATAAVRADLYIAHYPAALPAARAAARRHGARFAYDAEDFHPGDLPDGPTAARPNRWIDTLERQALPRAAYVTAASPGIADAYAEHYGIARPTVIRNTFPRAEAPSGATPAGTERPRPTLYWFSQTRGRDRGLECALEAVARASTRPHLHLRGDRREAFDARFLARARTLGCADRVVLLDPAAPSDMVALAARHDAGLAGETGHTRNRRIALTNKIFTYILAGIPAVLSDIPAHVAFAAETPGAALLYRTDDPASLAGVLDRLFGSPERLAAARAAAHALGRTTLNWEAEAPRLLACVAEGLSRRTDP